MKLKPLGELQMEHYHLLHLHFELQVLTYDNYLLTSATFEPVSPPSKEHQPLHHTCSDRDSRTTLYHRSMSPECYFRAPTHLVHLAIQRRKPHWRMGYLLDVLVVEASGTAPESCYLLPTINVIVFYLYHVAVTVSTSLFRIS